MVVTLDSGQVNVAGSGLWIAPAWYWPLFAIAFSTGQAFTVAFPTRPG
jgi:hypothetical protein